LCAQVREPALQVSWGDPFGTERHHSCRAGRARTRAGRYSAGTPLDRTDTTEFDDTWGSDNDIENLSSFVFAEQAPFGAEHVRQAYTLAGDTLALVVHERSGKRETDRVPFQQTLILQNQLLA
jgi:hypothetical protein